MPRVAITERRPALYPIRRDAARSWPAIGLRRFHDAADRGLDGWRRLA
ncbi:MAG: hypothetical protein ACREHD_04080 [Pirellulales bacterium]